MKPIGLQMYTLREEAAKDFVGVLKTVADIGYKGVEWAGMHGHDPKEIKRIIDDLGLVVCSNHSSLPTRENIQQIVEFESIFGNKRVISGFGPDDMKTVDQCKAVAAKFAEAAELLKPYGMTYGFHNHWWEFGIVDGKYAYDILMAEAPNVFSELDVYWCQFGKGDPVAALKKYGKRIPLLHVKDGMLQEPHPHTAVGAGKLDMPAIIGAADPNVCDWMIVELDACATDMTEAVRDSYNYLVGKGLAEGNKKVGGCCCGCGGG